MKKIKLTQNKFALVDDDDFDYLNKWKWYFNNGYAAKRLGITQIYMHGLINNSREGYETDHRNRDKLDNRRSNLRTVTRSQNIHNSAVYKNNTSGIKGVYWHKVRKKWKAEIGVNLKSINLGSFNNREEAALAYKMAARKHYHG